MSGLPRSGTSLLMSMLAAGGVPCLTDGERPADQHNPRGYFEHSRVLKLAEGNDWLREHGGQAVKILYRQLELLPPDLQARILLMERNLDEVVISQQRMLPSAELDWRDLFGRELRRFKGWLARRPWPILLVRHERLLAQPVAVAAEIAQFLERPLDLEKMAAQVDQGLYRSRK